MVTYTKGKLRAEGKTKKIWEVTENENLVIIENKTAITAFDDPKYTKQMQSKPIYATNTTCQVFELLKTAGIPVAYVKRISPTEFVAQSCEMFSIEAIARRFIVKASGFLKRNPQFNKLPFRFHRLWVEFGLKTTKGKAFGLNGETLVEGLNYEAGEEDPIIANPDEPNWYLLHKSKPAWDPESELRNGIPAANVLGNLLINQLENLLRDVFLVLEGAWNILGFRLLDIKIELGITRDGTLVVADVIDNDSWRVTTPNWIDISKQAFRDGKDMATVEKNYDLVSGLVDRFRIPHQCLVLWRSSEKDEFPEVSEDLKLNSIAIEHITASGHKSPSKCLRILEDLLSKYPDGGAIVTKVGMSNGLGPTIAARTSWPVVSIPATLEKNPEGIWSSLEMPSDVPLATICSDNNATGFALRILAQKNPLLYQQLQKRIEELDE